MHEGQKTTFGNWFSPFTVDFGCWIHTTELVRKGHVPAGSSLNKIPCSSGWSWIPDHPVCATMCRYVTKCLKKLLRLEVLKMAGWKAWGYMPVTLTPGRLRQRNCCEFEAHFSYPVSSRQCGYVIKPCLPNQTETNKIVLICANSSTFCLIYLPS